MQVPITAPAIAPSDIFDPPDDVAPLAVEEGTDVGVTVTPEGANKGMVSNSKRSNRNLVLPFVLEPQFVTTIVWYVSWRSGEA